MNARVFINIFDAGIKEENTNDLVSTISITLKDNEVDVDTSLSSFQQFLHQAFAEWYGIDERSIEIKLYDITDSMTTTLISEDIVFNNIPLNTTIKNA